MPGEAFRRVFWDIVADVTARDDLEAAGAGSVVDVNTRVAVVIEDEADIRSLLADVLQQAGFEVHTAATGLEGLELVERCEPIVTTLDVSMPGMDGFETAKRIRAFSSTYIVMLTARSDEIDTLQGLQSGADDYITKPFRPRELRARIEAMLRRPRAIGVADAVAPGSPVGPADPDSLSPTGPAAAARVAPAEEYVEGWIEHKGLRVHPEMRVAAVDDVELELTRSEFDILCDLLQSGRRVISKSDLVLMLRGERESGAGFVSDHDARAIEVHVANLRRKLGESATSPRWIETIRGVGYRRSAG